MEPLNVIYGLVDPRSGQLRYVGKSTTGAKQRLASHLCPSSLRDRTIKNGWIKSLLKKGLKPDVFVIEECERQDLGAAERHHVASLRSIGCDLTNMTGGGDGEGAPCSPEKRAKLSAATKGRRLSVRTAESYRQQGLRMTGRKRSAKAIAQTAAAKRGTKHEPAAIAKMVEAAQRKWAEPGYREKMSRAHGGRPFIDQFGRRYESHASAARALGLSVSCVSRVLAGKKKQAKGFTFSYVEI